MSSENDESSINIPKDNKITDINDIKSSSLNKALALELMSIISKSKDISILLEKKPINSIIEKINSSEYYNIHYNLDLENKGEINHFKENVQFLYKPLLNHLENEILFDIEFYKYGETFSSCLHKRYAIITRENFYSSTAPIEKFNEEKAKDKTHFIKTSTIFFQENLDDETKNDEWSNKNKKYRIKIQYNSLKNQVKYYFLYFQTKHQSDITLNMLENIKFKSLTENPSNIMKELCTIVTNAHLTYAVIKFLTVKNKVKNAKRIRDFINKNIIEKDRKKFVDFANDVMCRMKQSRKMLYNYPLYPEMNCIVGSYENKNNYLSHNKVTIQKMKSSVDFIAKNFMIKRENNNNNNKSKNVKFKLEDDNMLNINLENNTISFENKTNVDTSDFSNNDIYNISNIFYKIAQNERDVSENGIMIYGSKIDQSKVLQFKYEQSNNEVYYEKVPVDGATNEVLCFQIFHCVMFKDDITININDYYYIELSGGVNDTYILRTKPLHVNNTGDTDNNNNKYIIIEFNTQFFINSGMFNKKINLTLYEIPCEYIEDSKINFNEGRYRLSDDIVIEYLSKKEITSIQIAININNNGIAKYAYGLSSMNKSYIVTNVFPVKDTTISRYLCKDLFIGCNFYLIDALIPSKIKNLNDDSTIPNLVKYKNHSIALSEDNNSFILRNNPKIPTSMLSSHLNDNKHIINKIMNNNQFPFIPKCSITDSNSIQYTTKEIKTMTLCKFMGVNSKNEILFYNYNTNKYNSVRFSRKYIIPFQENMFNVINYSLLKQGSIEHLDNYEWKRYITPKNSYESDILIKTIQKMRRQINFNYENTGKITPKAHNINQKLLEDYIGRESESEKENKRTIKLLTLLIDKIEFRDSFILEDNCSMRINLFKSNTNNNNTNSEDNRTQVRLIDWLDENSLCKSNSKLQGYLKDSNQEKKIVLSASTKNEFNIDKNIFNSGNKYINYYSLPVKEREISMKINMFCDRVFSIEITLIYISKKTKVTYTSIIDIDDHISEANKIKNNKSIVDYLVIPIYISKSDKRIIGILNARFTIMAYKDNEEYEANVFNEENRTKIIDKYFKRKNNPIVQNIINLYNPNIQRRMMIKKTVKKFKKTIQSISQSELNNYLRQSGLNSDFIFDMSSNYNIKLMKKINKYEKIKKRNEFYFIFCASEWDILLNKLNTNNKEKVKNKTDLFPSIKDLQYIKSHNASLFNEIETVIGLGFPTNNFRKEIWNKLLSIDKLFELTLETLKSSPLIKKKFKTKGDIYLFFSHLVQSNNNISIIDSFIDRDIASMSLSTSNESVIKSIAKAFYHWTSLNISLNPNKTKFTYSYYYGILYIISAIFTSFSSPSEAFWIIIGLSQLLDIFRIELQQKDDDIGDIYIYIIIIKLLLESHFPKIYRILSSFNCSIDYFLFHRITSYFSNEIKYTEMVMRLMDIIIFESAMSVEYYWKSNNDNLNYLRFLCTIPITLLVENFNFVSAICHPYDFECFIEKSKNKYYNNLALLKSVEVNVDLCFYQKNFIDSILTGAQKEKDNSKWDDKKKTIQGYLYNYHYLLDNKDKEQYNKLLNELNKTKDIIKCNDWYEIIRKRFIMNKENNDGGGIIISINRIFTFGFANKIAKNEYSIEVYINGNNASLNENVTMSKIIIDEMGYCQSNKYIDIKYNSTSHSMDNSELCLKIKNIKNSQFVLSLINADLFEPYTTQIVSNTQMVIDISFMKYSYDQIDDNYSKLYLLFFSPPSINKDIILSNALYSIKKNSIIKTISMPIGTPGGSKAQKINEKAQKNKLNNIYQFYIKRYILKEKSSYSSQSLNLKANTTEYKQLNALLSSLFPKQTSLIQIILNILSSSVTQSTTLEILLRTIIDNSFKSPSISILLNNIYIFMTFSNQLNKLPQNRITLRTLEHTIYLIYKIYSIYIPMNTIKNMINYHLKKEYTPIIKNVLVFKEENINQIKDVLYENNIYIYDDIKNKNIKENHILPYKDITTEFILIYNYYCNTYEHINNDVIISILSSIINNMNINRGEYNAIVFQLIKELSEEEFYFKIDTIGNITKNNINCVYNNDNEKNTLNIMLLEFFNENYLNCNNYCEKEITYDVFIDILFSLPYIGDAIRRNCFLANNSLSIKLSITKRIIDEFIINIENNDKVILTFNFSSYNSLNKSETSEVYINYSINTFNTITDVLEIIKNKLLYHTLKIENSNVIKECLSIENVKFFGIKINNDTNIINPYLPLYTIMSDANKEIKINIDITEIYNRIIKDITYREGYSKLYLNYEKYYQWRRCIIYEKKDGENIELFIR